MNKFYNSLLVLGLVSFILVPTGCQESDQTTATDAAEAQVEQSVMPKESVMEADGRKAQIANSSSAKIIKTSTSGEIKPVVAGDPSLEFENLVHDFGKIGPNVYVDCEYKFTNTGKGALTFTKKPKAGCGCTVPRLAKMEYAAGESGVVKVKFHSNANPGTVKKYITIFSNDPDDPSLDLTLTAKVELAIVATPQSFNLSLKRENAGMEPIIITSKDGKPFSIKSFTSTDNIITAEIDKTAKATEYTINPTVDLAKLKGRPNGNISISLDHPNTNQVVLRFTTPPLFKVSSPQIFLIDPKANKPVKREILVISNYGEQVEIESIESSKNCMKVLSQEKKGNGVNLTIEVTPTPQGKNARIFYDSLKITLKGGETLRINATGTYRANKRLKKPTVKTSNVK